jgi:limonene-1,2-epoxide hydrolase
VEWQKTLEIARRLAEALDREDYSAARAVLAKECVYYVTGTTLAGPEAIISSFRSNGEMARGRFDRIEYTSRVEPTGPAGAAVITDTDRVRCGDEWHEYRCQQHVRVGAAGLVEEIRHEELPGERERLDLFKLRHSNRGT